MEVWRGEGIFQGYTGCLSFYGNELSILGGVQHSGPLGRVQGSMLGHAAEICCVGERRVVFSLPRPHSSPSEATQLVPALSNFSSSLGTWSSFSL